MMSKTRLQRNLAICVQPSVSIPSTSILPNLKISRGRAIIDIFPSTYLVQPIDVSPSPVQPLGTLRSAHGRPCPARPPIPDIRNYPQHELHDDDPERETKRQENVNTTLRMIDDALRLSR